MSDESTIYEALRVFADEVTAKSTGVVAGEAEEQLRAPFEKLIQVVGSAFDRNIVCVGETMLRDRLGKPDYAVNAGGLLAGYAELKAPGKGVTRNRLAGNDRRQFDRFMQLPNVLYTDGNEWALYQYGKRERPIVRLAGDVASDSGQAVSRESAVALLPLLNDFLGWKPIIPTIRRNNQDQIDTEEFVRQLAALCKFLREDVSESLKDESSPLKRIAEGWRQLLFPKASDERFADAYAQTVVFALLLARSLGAGIGGSLTLDNARSVLRGPHNLISAALEAITDREARAEIAPAVNTVIRLVDAVPVDALTTDADPWLHFYEDFLAEYDPQLRKDAGVYYTPIEVVRAQVRLIEDLLVNRLGQPQGFASPGVVTLDPAAGTGTYLLGVIEHTLQQVADHQGAGAVAGVAAQLARNIHGFEIMVGPYAVTELRVASTLRAAGGNQQGDGAQIYLTDTLESPNRQPIQGHFGPAAALSQEHERALRIKKDMNVLVCLGNPPYDRHPANSAVGGWVRGGDDGTGNQSILQHFLKPAIDAGHGGDLKNIYNLYTYFWRWALWKVFEQNDANGPGIVSFISASSYLVGDAFAGMREHMRRVCDAIWILDIGGEGRGTRQDDNVFNIQTPVAIAVAYRSDRKLADKPASVKYARVEGTRAEKLSFLNKVADLSHADWKDCPDDWQSPFRPAGTGDYFGWPLLTDLMPWQQSGVKAGRTWVISPAKDTLADRWRDLLSGGATRRKTLFKDSPTGRKVHEAAVQLPPHRERLQPISSLASDEITPEITRYLYRTLDRQSVFRDARVLDRPGPTLWYAHSDHQLYLTSLFSQPLDLGPALVASALIPDLDNFRGSYGAKAVLPLYRNSDATEPNILPGLLECLSTTYGRAVTPEDFVAYLYGILAQSAYTERYYRELDSQQVRVPLTKDRDLFERARALGARLLWLHTYGERFVPRGETPGRVPNGSALNTVGVPGDADGYPVSFSYDAEQQTLYVGDGQFAPVAPEVYEYEVSGLKVVQSWLKYRMRDGAGNKSSPLDDIRPAQWRAQFTTELLELLRVLEATMAMYPEQSVLLDAIVASECFAASELPTVPDGMRKAPPTPTATAKLV